MLTMTKKEFIEEYQRVHRERENLMFMLSDSFHVRGTDERLHVSVHLDGHDYESVSINHYQVWITKNKEGAIKAENADIKSIMLLAEVRKRVDKWLAGEGAFPTTENLSEFIESLADKD